MLRPEHSKKVDRIVRRQSQKHFVTVCEYVNVGNHLHLKIKARTRVSFRAFLISTTALLARAITGAKKGRAFGRFWDAPAFSRILLSSFEEFTLSKYFNVNALEAKMGTEIRLIFEGKERLVPI